MYLRNRYIQVDLKGLQQKRKLTRGTPQGGVLSPLAWNLVFDSFLELFNGLLVSCKVIRPRTGVHPTV